MHAPTTSLDEQHAAYMRHAAQMQQLAQAQQQQQQRPPMPASALSGSMASQGLNSPMQPPQPGTAAYQQAVLMRQQQAARQAGPPPLTAPTDGGPPFAAPLYPFFTRATPMEPGAEFPSISAKDQQRVKSWMQRDVGYEKELMGNKRQRKYELGAIAQDVMTREDWLGGPDERPPPRMRIRMDADRSRELARGKRGGERKEIKM